MPQRLMKWLEKHLGNLSIRRKLMMAFLGLALVPVIILGAFYVGNVLETSYQSTHQAIVDKVNISELLWNVRKQQLESAAGTIAHDNLVILNLDLSLFQALGAYLSDRMDRDKLSTAMILDTSGQVLASARSSYAPPAIFPIPVEILDSMAGDTHTYLGHLAGTAFAGLEGMEFTEDRHEMTVFAIQKIVNYNQVHTGYAVTAMVFGLLGGQGSTAFLADIEARIGTPVILSEGGQLIHGSGDLSAIQLPESLVSPSGTVNAMHELTGARENYLGMFKSLGMVGFGKEPDKLKPFYLGLALTESEYTKARNQALLVLGAILLFALAASFLIGYTLSHNLAQPIVAVSEGAREILNGNFEVRLPVHAHDEIGFMAEEFNLMTSKLSDTIQHLAREVVEHQAAEQQIRIINDELEARVTKRTEELTESNAALAESLSLLQRTQKHLVETEKLAALGNLVAGIAHELNTPLGVSMTASSFLKHKTQELESAIHGTGLTKGGLENYLLDVLEASRLLENNLGRTAEQLRFFKQIAVEQEAGVMTSFKLRDYLEEVQSSLIHHLRKGGQQFSNEVPAQITIHSWPGPLFQVLSNLVMNALQHAFVGQERGVITFSAHEQGDFIELIIADNGIGMDAETLARMFDPFFTTKRGSGRTGLGLSIVHNLVTVKLGGTIAGESHPGEGTLFRIRLPMKVDNSAATDYI